MSLHQACQVEGWFCGGIRYCDAHFLRLGARARIDYVEAGARWIRPARLLNTTFVPVR